MALNQYTSPSPKPGLLMIARIMLNDAELNITALCVYYEGGVVKPGVSYVSGVMGHVSAERGCVADQPQRLLYFQRMACL